MSDIKITMGVGGGDFFKADTVRTLVGTALHTKYPMEFYVVQSSMIHENRRRIAEAALENGSTHLFFVDTDMCFPDGTLTQLLSHDKDIIGVHYNCRTLPLHTTIKWANNEVICDGTIGYGVHECFAVGTGCILINTKVFKQLEKPWFWYERQPDGTCMTEDVYFCRAAKRQGFKVWYDGTITVKHISDYGY